MHVAAPHSQEKLEETRFCQPAMFVAGLAGVEKLQNTTQNINHNVS